MDEKKRNRHLQFWQPLEKGEGGYLAVNAPSGNDYVHIPRPEDPEEQWVSTDYRVKVAEAHSVNTYFGQDAINNQFVNFGPGVHAAILGSEYAFTRDSVWFGGEPYIKDWSEPIKTNKEHKLFKGIEEHTRALCAASKGRYTVSSTDIGGQYDVLYSLRGEDLLTDFIEYPDEVIAAESELNREFIDFFYYLTNIIEEAGCGFSSWMPIYSDIPYYPIQCDMSVMISQKMFEKFVLPSLDNVSSQIKRTIYHLDGKEQIQHLDMILSLKHVQAIQWVPSTQAVHKSGRKNFGDFADEKSFDIYKRTLAAGKKLFLYAHADQVPVIYETVGSDGVFIQTYCSSKKDADDLIETAKKNWIKI